MAFWQPAESFPALRKAPRGIQPPKTDTGGPGGTLFSLFSAPSDAPPQRKGRSCTAPIDPAILYFGTPVVLVSTENEDGSPNLAPMSSALWLGKSCMLGFGARSKTPANLLRTGERVLNLPSVAQVSTVDRLARTTGSNPVPPHKVAMGYQFEPRGREKIGTSHPRSS